MAAGKTSAVRNGDADASLRQRKSIVSDADTLYITEHGREKDAQLEQHQA